MNLSGLLPLLTESIAYRQLSDEMRQPHTGERSLPALRSARPFLAAALSCARGRPILYIAARLDRAQMIHETLRAYLGDTLSLMRSPEPSALFYERSPWATEVVAERLNVLNQLASQPTPQGGAQAASQLSNEPTNRATGNQWSSDQSGSKPLV